MLFTSLAYLFFFPVVFAAYWCAPKSWRRELLLFASYVFYMSWIPAYGLLLFFLTVCNYFLGLIIDKYRNHGKTIVTLGLIANIGALAYFKYTNFILDSIKSALVGLAPWLKLPFGPADLPVVNVILPLGISFFVFEFIHYIVDIYRGHKPIKNPIDFALFAAFFPSQIAGPIKRFQDFEKQLGELKPLNQTLVHDGITLILQGLFKKVALSDNLSGLVSAGYSHCASVGTVDAWIMSIAFSIQVYLDFSGYTDMGRGSALLLGFKLPDNFDLPYFATSLSSYWRRWHISLSTWLRDYLYIPMGGKYVSRARKHINLFITMLLGGLWHGAAWHYVLWGAMQGLMLATNHEYDARIKNNSALLKFHASLMGQFLGFLLTFVSMNFSLVVFRATNLNDAMTVYARMFWPHASLSRPLFDDFSDSTLPVALGAYIVYFILSCGDRLPVISKARAYVSSRAALARACGWPTRIAIYAGSFLAAVGFSPSNASPFIYFQF
ncbi:MAG: MBOAT family protein [Cyanobacteria bacterium REEB67]|nr:MBOAT family protein [Cyanobacteria bacterium REEB67]